MRSKRNQMLDKLQKLPDENGRCEVPGCGEELLPYVHPRPWCVAHSPYAQKLQRELGYRAERRPGK